MNIIKKAAGVVLACIAGCAPDLETGGDRPPARSHTRPEQEFEGPRIAGPVSTGGFDDYYVEVVHLDGMTHLHVMFETIPDSSDTTESIVRDVIAREVEKDSTRPVLAWTFTSGGKQLRGVHNIMLSYDPVAGDIGDAYFKPGKRESRLWEDSSGEFSVEATLVKSSGGSVTLRRTDNGREVVVPLSRLSDEAKQYVESQRP